jgi:hypothetical protein
MKQHLQADLGFFSALYQMIPAVHGISAIKKADTEPATEKKVILIHHQM